MSEQVEVDWREPRDESVMEIAESKKLKPITENQKKYFRAIETSTVTICTGPAGTGKTYIACGLAAQMLKDNKIDKIVLTRPLVPCGKGVGYLPGSLNEKVAPHLRPLLDALADFFPPTELNKLVQSEVIELCSLDLMRGVSIKNAVIICDEVQNAEYGQIHMVMTRFGQGSKLILAGDATKTQTDLKTSGINPFKEVIRKFEVGGHTDISIIKLTRRDIVRHGLTAFIDEVLADEHYEEDEWATIDCPDCGKQIWYETWAEDELIKCCHCKEIIEILDENNFRNPIVIDNGDFWVYCSHDKRPS